ncbi:unnamed protein product [Thlaspi arvense]|uniref:Uncharacterized protein n=1 Tax=Thlaspi arvense TaxID=13288 RepID=A0AAU9RFD0_THLAR|nr:unnamed protein product [Thlaspi arvense]
MVAKQICSIRHCHERALDRLQCCNLLIPLVEKKNHMMEVFVAYYCFGIIAGVGTWVRMFKKKFPERPFEGGVMAFAHILGVLVLFNF